MQFELSGWLYKHVPIFKIQPCREGLLSISAFPSVGAFGRRVVLGWNALLRPGLVET